MTTTKGITRAEGRIEGDGGCSMTSAPEAHKTAGVLELKPCPLCGGEALVEEIAPHSHTFASFMPDHAGSTSIECPRCGLGLLRNSTPAAAEAWNTRSTPSVPAVAELSGDGLPQPIASGAEGDPGLEVRAALDAAQVKEGIDSDIWVLDFDETYPTQSKATAVLQSLRAMAWPTTMAGRKIAPFEVFVILKERLNSGRLGREFLTAAAREIAALSAPNAVLPPSVDDPDAGHAVARTEDGGEVERAVLTERDLHYLRSILGHMREFRGLTSEIVEQHGYGVGGEALAGNIDWLDCFIDAHERKTSPDAERLREALADLVSWFDGGPSTYGPWIIRSGEYGADAAVEAARAALALPSPQVVDDRGEIGLPDRELIKGSVGREFGSEPPIGLPRGAASGAEGDMRAALNHASDMLSAHLERFHDYEDDTPAASDLRGIMHHIDGSLMEDDTPSTEAGDSVAAAFSQSTADLPQGVEPVAWVGRRSLEGLKNGSCQSAVIRPLCTDIFAVSVPLYNAEALALSDAARDRAVERIAELEDDVKRLHSEKMEHFDARLVAEQKAKRMEEALNVLRRGAVGPTMSLGGALAAMQSFAKKAIEKEQSDA